MGMRKWLVILICVSAVASTAAIRDDAAAAQKNTSQSKAEARCFAKEKACYRRCKGPFAAGRNEQACTGGCLVRLNNCLASASGNLN